MNWIILIALLGLLAYDLKLERSDKDTLSQAYQRLFPRWKDMIIGGAGLFVLCLWKYYIPELHDALFGVMAYVWGHVTFANKERYNS